MSWIGISTGRRAVVAPDAPGRGADPLLPTGTLTIELQVAADAGRRQTVIELDRHDGWQRRFRIVLDPEGGMFLEHRQGGAVVRTVLEFDRPERDATLRLTLGWHAPDRLGLLSAENLDSGDLVQTLFADPHPWPRDDISALIRAEGCRIDPSVTLIAVSDRVSPVGPCTGLAAGAAVTTPEGAVAVQNLRAGDTVLTPQNGFQSVRAVTGRVVPALGRFAPVRLRAPFFGLTRDLVSAPDHRLLVSGADAEYLFGADSVLVEARHLARMAAVPEAPRSPTIRYVQVLLDSHDCLSVGGAWAESLYLGHLADRPLRHATSVVAGLPAAKLPRHTRIASPQLCRYEAMVLVSAMCA